MPILLLFTDLDLCNHDLPTRITARSGPTAAMRFSVLLILIKKILIKKVFFLHFDTN